MQALIKFGNFGWGKHAMEAYKNSPATQAIQKSEICKVEEKKSKKGFTYKQHLVPEDKEELVRRVYQGFLDLKHPVEEEFPYEYVQHKLGEDQDLVLNTLVNRGFNGNENFIIEARAGSGKTYLCFETLLQKYSKDSPEKSILGLCFGKLNAQELQKKCPDMPNWDFRGFHSLAYRALKCHLGKRFLQINEFKIINKINQFSEIKELLGGDKRSRMIAGITSRAINKAIGLVMNTLLDYDNEVKLRDFIDFYYNTFAPARQSDFVDVDIMIKAIPIIIEQCKEDKKTFTFDEMLYYCAIWDVSFDRYHVIMIDEAQDTNLVQLAIAKKCMIKGGQLFAIGDNFQSIYSFRGSGCDSMNQIKEMFNCVPLSLNTTRRNPGVLTDFIKETFGIQIDCLNERRNHGEIIDIDSKGAFDLTTPEDMWLCRTRSDCVTVAMELISRDKQCIIVGNDSLISEIIGLGLKGSSTSVNEAIENLEQKEDKEEDGENIVKTTIKILQVSKSIDDFIDNIFRLLGEDTSGKIRIMTGHKSKGLEQEHVYCYRKNGQFGQFSDRQKDHEEKQEKNLEYVAYTRAIEKLYLVEA